MRAGAAQIVGNFMPPRRDCDFLNNRDWGAFSLCFSARYRAVLGPRAQGGGAVGRAEHVPSVKEKALFDEALVTG